MPKRTVKHAFVSYTTKDGNSVIVSRGDTADFPQAVIDRFEPYGAFLDEGETIQTIGDPRPLDPDADQADVDAWVAGVSAIELFAFIKENEGNDELSEKLEDAVTRLVDARVGTSTRDDVPEGLAVTADNLTTRSPATEVDAEGVSGPDNFNTGHPDDSPHPTGDDVADPTDGEGPRPDGGESEAFDEEPAADGSDDHKLEPLEVVNQNVDFVTAYLSRNPEMAEEILDAEKQRSEATGKDVRQGVVRAVEVAAGHTA